VDVILHFMRIYSRCWGCCSSSSFTSHAGNRPACCECVPTTTPHLSWGLPLLAVATMTRSIIHSAQLCCEGRLWRAKAWGRWLYFFGCSDGASERGWFLPAL